MNSETMAPEAQMMKFILGKWISKPIHGAATLGIPDMLADGKERSIDELADMTGTHEDALYRMMRALACVGIFSETQTRHFVNTPLSECLRKGRLRSAALLFHADWHDAVWNNLLFSLRTGNSAFEHVHGEKAFDWFGKYPEAAEIFHEANAFKAAVTHGIMARAYDFSDVSRITDVGGGFGGLLIEILKIHPHVKGVVAELPENMERLASIIQGENLAHRMTAHPCDFFHEIPSGSEVYLLSHILHDWSDGNCLGILRNCRKAMEDGGKLLVMESLITSGNDFSITKLLDLEMMLMGDGRERSEVEYRFLLETAGFQLSRVIPMGNDLSLLEGFPV